jgi:hypothetical protein
VGDGNVDGEIPLLSSFLYLLGEAERVRRSLRRRLSRCSRAKRAEWREARRTVLGPTALPNADICSRVIRFEDTARRGV